MKGRYEVKDSKYPTWRGRRFTKLEHARRDLVQAEPRGRFFVWDRLERRRLGSEDER